MAFSHEIGINWSNGSRGINAPKTYSGAAQQSLDESIPDSSTDLLVAFSLDVSAIKSIYILSDKAMTLETNNGTTPDDTISLLAGVPYIWNTDSYDTNKLTTDITALYMTTGSVGVAQFQLEVVTDPTP